MTVNQVYTGDCMKLCRDIPDKTVDLVVTSPPYADTKSYGKKVNILKPESFPKWILPIFKDAEDYLTCTGSFILNINDRIKEGARSEYVYRTILNILDNTDLKLYDRYIWHKQNGLPMPGDRLNDRIEYIFHFVKDVKNFKRYTDRVRVPYSQVTLDRLKYGVRSVYKVKDDGTTTKAKRVMREPNPLGTKHIGVFDFQTAGILRDNKHPAPFHPDLPRFFIKWLTDEGDLVLDPFLGGGTTAVEAKKMKRKYLGFDISEKYIEEIAKPRLKEV